MSGMISFDGLVSGINWSELTGQLMAAERQAKILPLQRREAQLMAKQAAWREVRSGLAALKEKLSSLKLESTYIGLRAESGDEEVVLVTATAGAEPRAYTIKVEQLATETRMWSNRLAMAEPLSVEAGEISLNGVTIGFSAGETISTLAAKINFRMNEAEEVAGGKVKASVVDGRLVLTAEATGSEVAIEVKERDDAGQNLLQQLGLAAVSEGYPSGEASGYVLGKDAVFYIDGVKIRRGSNKIDDAIVGLTLELTGVSKRSGAGDGYEALAGTRFTVGQDVAKAVSAIKAFVDEYNQVWKGIRDKQHWNKETEQGAILFGDSALSGIAYRLRSLVMDPVEGVADNWSLLAQIGISTGKVGAGVTADGTLHVDEAKLRATLLDDPEAVAALFRTGGVADRLDSYLAEVVTRDKMGLLMAKDEALSRQIKDLQKQTERMEERILRREEQMKRQYVHLEQVLAQLQAQGNWLSQQLALATRPRE